MLSGNPPIRVRQEDVARARSSQYDRVCVVEDVILVKHASLMNDELVHKLVRTSKYYGNVVLSPAAVSKVYELFALVFHGDSRRREDLLDIGVRNHVGQTV